MVRWKSRMVLLLIGAALCGGCASVTVTDEASFAGDVPTHLPKRFFVRDFDLAGAEIRQAEDYLSAITEPEDTGRSLSYQLVGTLREHLGPAWRLPEQVLPQEQGWIIDGELIRVAPGSAPMRIFVGFGAGGSKYETLVRLRHWDGRRLSPPHKQFLTTGGSGASPGLVAAAVDNPVTIALISTGPLATPFLVYSVSSKAVTETTARGVSDDSERTARMIVAAIADYLAQQGMLDQPPDLRVKRDWTDIQHVPGDVADWLQENLPESKAGPRQHPAR